MRLVDDESDAHIPSDAADVTEDVTDSVAKAFLGEKSAATTRRAYAAHLRDLAHFLSGDPDTSWSALLAMHLYQSDTPKLVQTLTGYKTHLLETKAAPATINRRLATVRSLLAFAHRMGASGANAVGLVDSVPSETLRDTRGVSLSTLRKLLTLPEKENRGPDGKTTIKVLRDAALLRLFCENGLRRGEIVSLDVADFEPLAKRLFIRRKGQGGQKQPITLTPKGIAALRTYIRATGHKSVPLFQNVSHRPEHEGAGLTGDAIHKIVATHGESIGLLLASHKLRHSAITAVLHEVKGDVRQAQEFSRHKDIRTLSVYDDRRRDSQGKVSRTLSRKL